MIVQYTAFEDVWMVMVGGFAYTFKRRCVSERFFKTSLSMFTLLNIDIPVIDAFASAQVFSRVGCGVVP